MNAYMKIMKTHWQKILSPLCAAIVLVCLWPRPISVVAFDMARVKSLLIRQLAEHTVSNAQAVLASKVFKHLLNDVLVEYAHKHHVLIVDKALVLQGAKDITAEVMPRLSQSMRGKS